MSERNLHRISREEAELVRHVAAGDDPAQFPNPSDRIWRPEGGTISEVEATGRAACRECGETIPEGTPAIVFGFDPTGNHWALGRAYIHAAECRTYPEEGT